MYLSFQQGQPLADWTRHNLAPWLQGPTFMGNSHINFFYLSFRSCHSCHPLPEPKHHSFLFSHWSASKCLVFMAAHTPSIHVFLGRPPFLLSPGIHSIINFGSLSSCILLMWPYHWSLFLSMMSIISGFSFTPIISFICSFFILSILNFLVDLLSTSISVDKILFLSLVGICHTSAPYIKMLWIIVW